MKLIPSGELFLATHGWGRCGDRLGGAEFLSVICQLPIDDRQLVAKGDIN